MCSNRVALATLECMACASRAVCTVQQLIRGTWVLRRRVLTALGRGFRVGARESIEAVLINIL